LAPSVSGTDHTTSEATFDYGQTTCHVTLRKFISKN
jgi:hypothetical protein